ncbi:MAG: LON peptidase substrate-binding domain-containing protein [Verrucomicrobiota bacterium]|nr:LON peptidase substrate-binding domain-containing protein [Chthoniobacterales bacterium]MDQ3414742.1 LON peptidase substrate-binding domain-containing protein [Verrucomicrobiota bacterium]
MPETVELPNAVPVMPLTGILLFPNALLPLHIFEPRFRKMLAHALDDDRMLCVALVRPERQQWRTSDDFFPVSTVGLIRACVGRSDGTSDLILQGIRRVKFRDFEQETPFPIARIKPLKTRTKLTVETDALAAKVLEFYTRLKESGRELPEKIDLYLSEMNDPEMLADLIAATFISDPARRQQLLEELDLNQRLRLLIQFLREELL